MLLFFVTKLWLFIRKTFMSVAFFHYVVTFHVGYFFCTRLWPFITKVYSLRIFFHQMMIPNIFTNFWVLIIEIYGFVIFSTMMWLFIIKIYIFVFTFMTKFFWKFYLNVWFYVSVLVKYNPMRASSYLPLPKELKAKQGCLNIQNND